MNILVLGAGQMAYGIVFDLLKNHSLNKIFIIDEQLPALQKMENFFTNKKLEFHCLRADNLKELKPIFIQANGAISAVPYDYNVGLTQLAIETQTHFVDLGGNNTIVEKQFNMDQQAKMAQIGIIPDCGLAPGMTSVIAAHAIDQLARVDDVQIRVGGLPLSPQTPLKYKLVFSVHGLINEYIEPVIILEDGRIKNVAPMSGIETLNFPSPFGILEAFYTSGGISTLPYTFEGKINNLDYKTIRYPGHASLMKNLIDLGFTNKKATFKHNEEVLNTRDIFESMLSSSIQYKSEDVVLIRVSAKGQKEGKEKIITYQAIEYGDRDNSLTAMMRTTAFPAAIILQMLVEGKIKDRGVLKQELAVPGYEFIGALEERRIFFDTKEK